MLRKGASALSNAELVAILIGSGHKEMSALDLAKQILHSQGNRLDNLARLSVMELQKFKGIGEAKAVSIAAALELGRRRKGRDADDRKSITSSRDAYEILYADMNDLIHEEFRVLYLDTRHRVKANEKIGMGGFNYSNVDVGLLFRRALEHTATAVILAHNHPSGQLKPSSSDINLTRKIKDSGKILNINVLDHLIIGGHSYFSFADEAVL